MIRCCVPLSFAAHSASTPPRCIQGHTLGQSAREFWGARASACARWGTAKPSYQASKPQNLPNRVYNPFTHSLSLSLSLSLAARVRSLKDICTSTLHLLHWRARACANHLHFAALRGRPQGLACSVSGKGREGGRIRLRPLMEWKLMTQ